MVTHFNCIPPHDSSITQTHHCELVILFERVTPEQVTEANEFMKSRDVADGNVMVKEEETAE